MTKRNKKKQMLRNDWKYSYVVVVLLLISLLGTACFNKENAESVEQLQQVNTIESPDTNTLPQVPEPTPSLAPVETSKAEESSSPTGRLENSQFEMPAESNVIEPEQDLSNAKQAQKQSIDREIEDKITALRNECRATSDSLLQSMLDELSGNEVATLKTLQAKFVGKLLAAEQSCDGSFGTLLKAAEDEYAKEGIPKSEMPDWNSQYNEEKAAVRASAIAKLLAAMK